MRSLPWAGLAGRHATGLLSGDWQFAKDDEEGMRKVIHTGLTEKGNAGFRRGLKPVQEALNEYVRANQGQDPVPTGTVPPKVKDNE